MSPARLITTEEDINARLKPLVRGDLPAASYGAHGLGGQAPTGDRSPQKGSDPESVPWASKAREKQPAPSCLLAKGSETLLCWRLCCIICHFSKTDIFAHTCRVLRGKSLWRHMRDPCPRRPPRRAPISLSPRSRGRDTPGIRQRGTRSQTHDPSRPCQRVSLPLAWPGRQRPFLNSMTRPPRLVSIFPTTLPVI